MFDTNSRFLRSNAKPNGSAPLVGLLIAGPVVPSELTLNVVSWPGGGMTSVTTSVLPVLSNPMPRAAVPGRERQRLGRVGDRRHVAVAADADAGDVGAADVQHVEQPLVDREALRQVAAGGLRVDELQALARLAERADGVAARVDGEDQLAVRRDVDRTVAVEDRAAGAAAEVLRATAAAGRNRLLQLQLAVVVAVVLVQPVLGHAVRLGVDRADNLRLVLLGLRLGADRERHCERRECGREKQEPPPSCDRKDWSCGCPTGHLVIPLVVNIAGSVVFVHQKHRRDNLRLWMPRIAAPRERFVAAS